MNNLTQPAYPVVPLQDNFKRLIVPIPGLSKLEHFALEIYKIYLDKNKYIRNAKFQPDKYRTQHLEGYQENMMNLSINDAITFLEKLDEKHKTLNNDKSNEMAIFDR